MEDYILTRLNDDNNYCLIITLLDYEIRITDYLKSIELPYCHEKKILIDTALCSGVNRYRFIGVNANDEGKMNSKEMSYVNVDSDTLAFANKVILKNPEYISSSILTESQIKKLRNNVVLN